MRRPRRRRRELLSDRVRDGRGDELVAGVVRVHRIIIKLGVYVAVRVIKIREVRVDQDRIIIMSDALDDGRHLDVQDVDVRPFPRFLGLRDGRRHEHDGVLVGGVPQFIEDVLVGVRELVGTKGTDGLVAPLFALLVPKATTNALALRESSRASSPCDVSIQARQVRERRAITPRQTR